MNHHDNILYSATRLIVKYVLYVRIPDFNEMIIYFIFYLIWNIIELGKMLAFVLDRLRQGNTISESLVQNLHINMRALHGSY